MWGYFIHSVKLRQHAQKELLELLKQWCIATLHTIKDTKYDDKLQDVVKDYNNRPHRSLNEKTPVEITNENDDILWKELNMDTVTPSFKREAKRKPTKRFNFKRGDLVRLFHLQKVFDRDYQEKLFNVNSRKLRQGIPVYKVVDFDKDPIKGTLYKNELQRVRKDPDKLWRAENILKQRTRNVRKEVFVKWLGWPKNI